MTETMLIDWDGDGEPACMDAEDLNEGGQSYVIGDQPSPIVGFALDGFPIYGPGDMTAPFASGSSGFDAMVIVPCSGGAIGRIATGVSVDLVGRAADVMLKERRKLICVLRESPYSLVLTRNMVTVTEAGGVILPASPSFYSHPKDRTALLDTVTARILDQLGIDNDLMKRWSGHLVGKQQRGQEGP